MLPLSAPLNTQTAPATIDAPTSNGGNRAENGGFGVLLAQLGDGAAGQPAHDEAAATAAAATIPAGKGLPDGGKDLPVAEDAETDEPAAAPVVLLPLPANIQIAGSPAPAQPALDTPREPATGDARPASTPPLPAPVAPPRLAPGQDQPAPALPVLQVAATELPEAGRVLPEPPRYAPPPRLAASLRVKLEGAAGPAPLRDQAIEALLPGAAASPAATSHQSLGFALASVTANPGQPGLATPAAEAMMRPQDFAQLIDRLVSAREAALPQAASLSLAHTEFGRIDLSFTRDGNGLSVALASPDPDFARAVQAAVPPAPTASDAGTQRQPGSGTGSHDGASAQSHGSHSGQPSAQGDARRDGRPTDQPMPGRTRAERAATHPARDLRGSGIFA
jgi:hypothetical protein